MLTLRLFCIASMMFGAGQVFEHFDASCGGGVLLSRGSGRLSDCWGSGRTRDVARPSDDEGSCMEAESGEVLARCRHTTRRPYRAGV